MYKIGIVGLGNIAYKYSTPDQPYPYCHAGGARLSDRVEVVAAADLDAERRDDFNGMYGPVRLYESADAMFRDEQLDIIAVCVRGPIHEDLTLAAIEAGPRVVFEEKPAGCSLQQVDNIHRAAADKGVLVVVSHSRHWGPHVLHMAKRIQEGLIGDVQSVVGYCRGTILSFSVHETDMICQFAGYDPVAVTAMTRPGDRETPEGWEVEPQIHGALIRYASGVAGFHVGNDGPNGAFYVDVFGTEGRAFVPFYGVPKAWDSEKKEVPEESLGLPAKASPFLLAYEQIADYLDTGAAPDCGPEMYRPVNEVAFGMIESGASGQTVPLPCAKRDRLIFANG